MHLPHFGLLAIVVACAAVAHVCAESNFKFEELRVLATQKLKARGEIIIGEKGSTELKVKTTIKAQQDKIDALNYKLNYNNVMNVGCGTGCNTTIEQAWETLSQVKTTKDLDDFPITIFIHTNLVLTAPLVLRAFTTQPVRIYGYSGTVKTISASWTVASSATDPAEPGLQPAITVVGGTVVLGLLDLTWTGSGSNTRVNGKPVGLLATDGGRIIFGSSADENLDLVPEFTGLTSWVTQEEFKITGFRHAVVATARGRIAPGVYYDTTDNTVKPYCRLNIVSSVYGVLADYSGSVVVAASAINADETAVWARRGGAVDVSSTAVTAKRGLRAESRGSIFGDEAFVTGVTGGTAAFSTSIRGRITLRAGRGTTTGTALKNCVESSAGGYVTIQSLECNGKFTESAIKSISGARVAFAAANAGIPIAGDGNCIEAAGGSVLVLEGPNPVTCNSYIASAGTYETGTVVATDGGSVTIQSAFNANTYAPSTPILACFLAKKGGRISGSPAEINCNKGTSNPLNCFRAEDAGKVSFGEATTTTCANAENCVYTERNGYASVVHACNLAASPATAPVAAVVATSASFVSITGRQTPVDRKTTFTPTTAFPGYVSSTHGSVVVANRMYDAAPGAAWAATAVGLSATDNGLVLANDAVFGGPVNVGVSSSTNSFVGVDNSVFNARATTAFQTLMGGISATNANTFRNTGSCANIEGGYLKLDGTGARCRQETSTKPAVRLTNGGIGWLSGLQVVNAVGGVSADIPSCLEVKHNGVADTEAGAVQCGASGTLVTFTGPGVDASYGATMHGDLKFLSAVQPAQCVNLDGALSTATLPAFCGAKVFSGCTANVTGDVSMTCS